MLYMALEYTILGSCNDLANHWTMTLFAFFDSATLFIRNITFDTCLKIIKPLHVRKGLKPRPKKRSKASCPMVCKVFSVSILLHTYRINGKLKCMPKVSFSSLRLQIIGVNHFLNKLLQRRTHHQKFTATA